jgi:hypothetical protein
MGVFRIVPSADTWITTQLDSSNTALTGANFGSDPVLSVFARKSNRSN